MQYREIGQSGITASAITFGAWAIGGWMWGGADRKEALEAILASYELGVTSIDTAPAYGQGLSEEIVGDALKVLPRHKLQILTKYGLRWDMQKGQHFFSSKFNNGSPLEVYKYAGKESVIEECEQCLKRLGTDYIDLFQIHWADPTTPIEETMEAIVLLQKQGKIRAGGVCNYTADQMKVAETVVSLASNQVPYSMVFRDIEKEVVPYCIENKKAVIAYSPLHRGLLTGKFKPGHIYNDGDTRETNRFYTAENINRTNVFLDTIKPLAADKNITLAQLVIAWTLQQRGITLALVGARNADQATQNAKASDVIITPEEMSIINNNLSKLALVF